MENFDNERAITNQDFYKAYNKVIEYVNDGHEKKLAE